MVGLQHVSGVGNSNHTGAGRIGVAGPHPRHLLERKGGHEGQDAAGFRLIAKGPRGRSEVTPKYSEAAPKDCVRAGRRMDSAVHQLFYRSRPAARAAAAPRCPEVTPKYSEVTPKAPRRGRSTARGRSGRSRARRVRPSPRAL